MKKYNFENVVAETLLIPLYMRAKESTRVDAILKDSLAESLINKIDYDYSSFEGATWSEVGCVVRGRYFDKAVSNFIRKKKNAIVVNVGCGLDTRFQRVGINMDTLFYDMDLPEVIKIRHEFLPETKLNKYIAASILETEWLDQLKINHPDSSFIFIIEGVLMYFSEDKVKAILHNFSTRFPGGEIWFDVCGTWMVKHNLKPDSLRKHSAEIRSGISDGHEVETWNPKMQLLRQDIYQKYNTKRWGFAGYMLCLFPFITKKFSSLLGFQIKP